MDSTVGYGEITTQKWKDNSVITNQNGKELSKDIQTLFMEMCDTVVISVITRQH